MASADASPAAAGASPQAAMGPSAAASQQHVLDSRDCNITGSGPVGEAASSEGCRGRNSHDSRPYSSSSAFAAGGGDTAAKPPASPGAAAQLPACEDDAGGANGGSGRRPRRPAPLRQPKRRDRHRRQDSDSDCDDSGSSEGASAASSSVAHERIAGGPAKQGGGPKLANGFIEHSRRHLVAAWEGGVEVGQAPVQPPLAAAQRGSLDLERRGSGGVSGRRQQASPRCRSTGRRSSRDEGSGGSGWRFHGQGSPSGASATQLFSAASLAATAALAGAASEDSGNGCTNAQRQRNGMRGHTAPPSPLSNGRQSPSLQQQQQRQQQSGRQQQQGRQPQSSPSTPRKQASGPRSPAGGSAVAAQPRTPNGKIPAPLQNGYVTAASADEDVQDQEWDSEVLRAVLPASLPVPLTRDLLRRFGLDVGPLNGALMPDQARVREHLARMTPEVLPEALLAQLTAAAVAVAVAGSCEGAAAGNPEAGMGLPSPGRQQQPQMDAGQHVRKQQAMAPRERQQRPRDRDRERSERERHHHHQQAHHRHHHYEHQMHFASFEGSGTLSERSAPPAPAGGTCEPSSSDEGWQPVVNRRSASRATAAAADRSDTMSDPGTYAGAGQREQGGRHAHGRMQRGGGGGGGGASGRSSANAVARGERHMGQEHLRGGLGGHAMGDMQRDARQYQQHQHTAVQQQVHRRGGGGRDDHRGAGPAVRGGSGPWVSHQQGPQSSSHPPTGQQGQGTLAPTLAPSPAPSSDRGPQWGAGARGSRLLQSPRSLPAQSPCRSSPNTPAARRHRGGLPPAPLPAPMMLPPAALGTQPMTRTATAASLAALASGGIGLGSEPVLAATDLERFLLAASPTIKLERGVPLVDALRRLTLADVWAAFLDASLVGSPVATMGGARGPSTAYYVPYLSAMQVFVEPQQQQQQQQLGGVAADGQDQRGGARSKDDAQSWAAVAAGSVRPSAGSTASSGGNGGSGGSSPGSSSAAASTPLSAAGSARSSVSGAGLPPLPLGVTNAGRLYACDVDGWPSTMQVLCEHMEHELPFHREPLALQLETMSAPPQQPGSYGAASHGGAGSGRPPVVGPALSDAHLVDLHPASWFAVAWYPVYRIPDAPLSARFLCFYSLALPLQLLAEAEALAESEVMVLAESEAEGEAAPPAAAAGSEAEGGQVASEDEAGRGAVGGGSFALEEIRLPIVGLKWCDLRGERWFESFPEAQRAASGIGEDFGGDSSSDGEEECVESGAAAAAGAVVPPTGDAGCKDAAASPGAAGGDADGEVATGDDDATSGSAEAAESAESSSATSGSCSCCAPGTPCGAGAGGAAAAAAAGGAGTTGVWSSPGQRDLEMQARLAELQATAERLARGSWLKVLDTQGPRALKLYHSDFEFFHSRS